MASPAHKNRIFFFVFLLCQLIVQGQNWQPVAPANKYHYTLTGSNRYATVMADSFNASTVYVNRVVALCDTCSHIHVPNFYYDTTYVWINQGGFLQKEIRTLPNNTFCLSGTKHLLLKLNEPMNSPWLYDTTAAVQARVVLTATQMVLGATDSVKRILLSSGDSILASKNHGILHFPSTYGQHKSYHLVGIEGMQVGFQMPRFSGFYEFNVGDVFQYQNTDDNYSFLPPKFKRGVEKRTVLSKQVLPNGFNYLMRIIRVDSTWYGNGSKYYTISDSTKMVSYTDSAMHFTNLYPKQIVHFNHTFTNTFLDSLITHVECELESDQKIVKRMGVVCPYVKPNRPDNPYGIARYSHLVKDFYVAPNSYFVFGRAAKEGLGIISDLYNNYELLKEYCLSASVKNGDTTGHILDDEAILSINDLQSNNHFSIYPNPVRDYFEVTDDNGLENLSIVNTVGELVATFTNLGGVKAFKVNTESFPNGVYILVSEKKNQRYYEKLVVER